MEHPSLQTQIAAALLIDTPHEEIAADLGVPVERVRAEVGDQIRATIRNSNA